MSFDNTLKNKASIEKLFNPWLGQICTNVEKTEVEHQWFFYFGDKGKLLTECLWRIVANGAITLTSRDEGQIFGLPKPVNAGELASEMLSHKIKKINIVDETCDLHIYFDDVKLEIVNDSSGYDTWSAFAKNADKLHNIVAGAGRLALW